MKPVMSKTFGKNGDVIETFTPTSRQMLYAMCKAKNPTWSDPEIAKELGFGSATIGSWKRYGSAFTSWLEEFIDQHAPDKEAELLHAVGMVEALQGNYNFWKDLAKSKGVIKEDTKNLTINLNTDFSHISIGDFNEQRARILSELRGVGVSGKSGVAEPVTIEHQGSNKGPGNRAGKVQGRPMAFLDTLGTDRGRNGTAESVPAVSEQEASTGGDSLLAEHNEAMLSKK